VAELPALDRWVADAAVAESKIELTPTRTTTITATTLAILLDARIDLERVEADRRKGGRSDCT
jgi:hypothetical protein